jgi:hypothetical protein
MTLEEIKKIDLVSYLAKSAIHPKRNSGKYAFYLSPLTEETQPSFCINKAKNSFRCYSSGTNGSIIDFVMAHEKMNFKEAIAFLKGDNISDIQEYIPSPRASEPGVKIHNERQISYKPLISKLTDVRKLDYDLLRAYTVEIDISFPHGKNPDAIYTVIGMKNDAGGVDFRGMDDWLKMSTAPKTYTTISGDKSKYAVYEGFLDFISHLMIMGVDKPKYQSYILNGLSQMPSLLPFINSKEILFYLDNDKAADSLLKTMSDCRVNDRRCEYAFYKDINDWLRDLI